MSNERQIPLRQRYLTGGVVKKNAVKGNGDSGTHKRHKLAQKDKDKLAAQPVRVLVYDAQRGRGVMKTRTE